MQRIFISCVHRLFSVVLHQGFSQSSAWFQPGERRGLRIPDVLTVHVSREMTGGSGNLAEVSVNYAISDIARFARWSRTPRRIVGTL